MPVEGFRNPVATDGSLLGVSDRWVASVWSVVQLDHDEDVGPMHEMYGTLDPGLEVQRTSRGSSFVTSEEQWISPQIMLITRES